VTEIETFNGLRTCNLGIKSTKTSSGTQDIL
jgi:hypothetical protein